MKNLISILLFLSALLLLSSCQDDAMISQTSEEKSISIIEGSISNWDGKSNKVIVFGYGDNIIFGVSKVNGKGDFMIEPGQPSENCLRPISLFPSGGVCSHQLKFSDPDARSVIGSFSVFTPGEQGTVGFLYKLNVPLNNQISQIGGFFSVQYIFVDRPVKIEGKEVCQYDYTNDGQLFSITQQVNLNLKRGWNKIVYRSKAENSSYSVIEVSNAEPEGGQWIYDAI